MDKFQGYLKWPRRLYNALQNICVQDRTSSGNPREFTQKEMFLACIQEVLFSNPGGTLTIHIKINNFSALSPCEYRHGTAN